MFADNTTIVEFRKFTCIFITSFFFCCFLDYANSPRLQRGQCPTKKKCLDNRELQSRTRFLDKGSLKEVGSGYTNTGQVTKLKGRQVLYLNHTIILYIILLSMVSVMRTQMANFCFHYAPDTISQLQIHSFK